MPTFLQNITRTNPRAFDYFGSSVVFSGNGETLVITAEAYDSVPRNLAVISLYDLVGGKYVFNSELQLPSYITVNHRPATSISINHAGNILAVNAVQYKDPNDSTQSGRMFIYIKVGGSWILRNTLTNFFENINNQDRFGYQLQLDASGNTLVSSDPFNDNGGVLAGAVYVMITNDNWLTYDTQFLVGGVGGINVKLGTNCAISPNGNTVFASENGTVDIFGQPDNQGQVVVYNKDANGFFNQVAAFEILAAPDAAVDDLFGIAVSGISDNIAGRPIACSSDGNILVVGAIGKANSAGAFYTFSRLTGGKYSFVSQVNHAESFALVGYSVAISRYGEYSCVSAQGENNIGDTDVGANYIYENDNNGNFNLTERLVSPIAEPLSYGGFKIDITAKGDYFASGSVQQTVNGINNAGSVDIWTVEKNGNKPIRPPKYIIGGGSTIINTPTVQTYSDLVIAAQPDAYYQQDELILPFLDSIGSQDLIFEGQPVIFGSDPLKTGDPKASVYYPIGSLGRLVLSAGSNLHNGGDIAIEAIIKIDSNFTDDLRIIVHKGTSDQDATTDWQMIVLFNDRIRFQNSTFPSWTLDTPADSIIADQRHYIVANLSVAGAVEIYIDGLFSASKLLFPRVETLGDIYISAEPFASDYLLGWQSDTAFYGRLLSQEEITQRANKALNG